MSKEVICRIKNITKLFPGVVALNDVSFDVHKGEVHAVVGENGAGKSTLMNVLSGVYHPDSGSVEFNGKTVRFNNPREAQKAGIAMIHQELSLAAHMTAGENIFQGRMPKGKLGFLNKRKMYKDSEDLLDRLGVSFIDPKMLVSKMSVSEMQLLEIAKAISLEAQMLIMDEPTSSLTTTEIEFLMKIIDGLRDQNVAILYISHKLEEIMRISDKITVLRDGEHIDTRDSVNFDEKSMINLMVGREFSRSADRQFIEDYADREKVLEVKDLSDFAGRVKNVSFDLYRGEVLGLTGLVGAGRTEVLQCIFGANQRTSGSIKVNGRDAKILKTSDAIKLGMALVPEGRKTQGIFSKMSVENNMTIVYLKNMLNMFKLVNRKKSRQVAMEYVKKLNIKAGSMTQNVDNLSGGNQQKTIIARWLMNLPQILFMDEPTHGIDVGAKSEIYRIINDLSKQGVSIIMISSEMPEVLSVCDRILVMHHGTLRGQLKHAEADQEKIMMYTLESTKEDVFNAV
jgi:ABC-type sugar transport system ATPase subunit